VAIHTVSAVLFAQDLQRVAAFYREVLGALVLHSDAEHEVLSCLGFQIVVHRITPGFSQSVSANPPPERRERAALRLNFPVDDIAMSRMSARRLGGQIDDVPPTWAANDGEFFLGYDPEGNVIGVVPAKS
jgi:predicted enzyme related to lactoylglutathione lyase